MLQSCNTANVNLHHVQEGETDASPYNPVSGSAADMRYVKCVNIEDAAQGIKTFTFSYPEPAGLGKPEPFRYQAGQYASFDFQVGLTASLICSAWLA